MRFPAIKRIGFARIWFVALLAGAAFTVAAPAAQAIPAFGVDGFVAANCLGGTVHEEKCAQEGPEPFTVPKEPSVTEVEAEGYRQAAGHPPLGITFFKINTIGKYPNAAPTGIVTHVRTDVAPGVSANPQAMEKCSFAEFGEEEPLLPGSSLYPEQSDHRRGAPQR
jgi:hypothetical protein